MKGLGFSGGRGRVEDCLLVCLSNLTESGLIERRERELEFYLECLKPILQREQTVLVKGHPRETLGQSDEVASMIRELGFDSRSLGTANVVPTECLAATLPVSCLVSLISNVPTTWRLLNPRTTLIIGVEPELVGRYLSAAGRKMFSLDLNDSRIFLLTSQATRAHSRPSAYPPLRNTPLWRRAHRSGWSARTRFISERMTPVGGTMWARSS